MRATNHVLTVAILMGGGLFACAKKEKPESELASITNVVESAAKLPTCSAETISQVFWVEEQEKLYVCNGSKFVEIKGEKGSSGEKGASGEKGSSGEKGPAGSAANSGIWVFDKDSKPVGVLMDATLGLILFTNGAYARINLTTGDYKLPVILSSNGVMEASGALYSCAMSDADCAGTCYVGDPTPRGAILRTKTSTFYVSTGVEQLVTGATVRSGSNPNGTCDDLGGPTLTNGYAITKVYTFPEGISLPLKTPLSYGFKAGD